jgi:hypothetical protein
MSQPPSASLLPLALELAIAAGSVLRVLEALGKGDCPNALALGIGRCASGARGVDELGAVLAVPSGSEELEEAPRKEGTSISSINCHADTAGCSEQSYMRRLLSLAMVAYGS